MDKNPNNPNCSCDELDGDILDEDGYTCYTCFEGNFDKAGDAVIALSVPEIHADIDPDDLAEHLRLRDEAEDG